MSDTFDHEGDAWDSYERAREAQDFYAPGYEIRSRVQYRTPAPVPPPSPEGFDDVD